MNTSERDDAALYESLKDLLPWQFDAVVLYAGAPREFFSPATVAPAARATEMVQWARQRVDHPDRIRAALGRVSPPLVADAELLKWQQWCYREFRRVPLVGFENRERVYLDLDDIFVPLRVSPTFAARFTDSRGEHKAAPDRTVEGDEPGDVTTRELTIFEALQETERARVRNPALAGLSLIGDPGAGKTTLLRHVYCRVMREGSAAVGLPADLVPVLMRFSRLEALDRKPRALAEALRREADANGYAGAADALLSSGRKLLVLLDGLDEVRDEPTRVELARWLEHEIEHWDGWRFVATCRAEVHRREPLTSNRFLDASVQWLDDDAVREYVRRWFQAVVRGQDYIRDPPEVLQRRASERAEALLKVVLGPEFVVQYRLRELRSNPLLLSTLCLVHQSGHKLPRQRGELYNRCISLLLEAWQLSKDEEAKATGARGDGDAGPRYLPNDKARVVLQPLAWAMQVSGERTIDGVLLREIIREPLRRARDEEFDLSPEEFVRLARERCGVLVSRDIDRYEFFHLSFQEYLAAAHARDAGVLGELAARADDPRWHEVILLAVSAPGVLRTFAHVLLARGDVAPHAELLEACLREAPTLDHEPFTDALARASLHGPASWLDRMRRRRTLDSASLATLLRLFQGRDEPRFWAAAAQLRDHHDPLVRSLAVQGTRAVAADRGTEPTSPPVIVGGAAPTGRRPGEVWVEPTTGLTLVWIPPGEFLMGSSQAKGEPGYDPEAYDNEVPPRRVRISEGFWIGQHPVTNEQYGRFVAQGGAEPGDWRNRRFNSPQQPVVGMSATDARGFCKWATKDVGLTGEIAFDLPTEAEWEFAARGEEGRRYPWGQEKPTATHAVWGLATQTGAAAVIGQRPRGATPLGVHDMAGNVWEWCLDDWRIDYRERPRREGDPCVYSGRGALRVSRGGCWDMGIGWLRAAHRFRIRPGASGAGLGFRVVCRRFRQDVTL